MRVLFINNDGGGFADHIEVPEGTTVAALFAERLPGRQPAGRHADASPGTGRAFLARSAVRDAAMG